LIELLVLNQDGLAALNIKFNSSTMNALQDSFLYHNPPNVKIAHLLSEHQAWKAAKANLVATILDTREAEKRLIRSQSMQHREKPRPPPLWPSCDALASAHGRSKHDTLGKTQL
jgi:hypothetical protein